MATYIPPPEQLVGIPSAQGVRPEDPEQQGGDVPDGSTTAAVLWQYLGMGLMPTFTPVTPAKAGAMAKIDPGRRRENEEEEHLNASEPR